MAKGAARRERMRALVERWRGSGEPASRFARRHGLRAQTFDYWKRKLGGASLGAGGRQAVAGAEFIPVQLVGGEAARTSAIEVRLVSGDVVVCDAGVGTEALRAVIGLLRERC